MTERSLGRTLWTLFLAVLNATLILLALCLWLGWSLFSTVERITDDVAEITTTVLPVRAEIRDLTTQIGETRGALAALRAGGAEPELCLALEERLVAAEARLAALTETLKTVAEDLYPSIEAAAGTAFGNFGSAFATTLLSAIGLAPDASAEPQPSP